ncbi:hypothetical protein [Mumia sp. DW29H23]|uniref:hypothetical protein n=1 Tax=Mumia sp. DW29H23 TaxID=3421241 RepID=UPI003D69ACC3
MPSALDLQLVGELPVPFDEVLERLLNRTAVASGGDPCPPDGPQDETERDDGSDERQRGQDTGADTTDGSKPTHHDRSEDEGQRAGHGDAPTTSHTPGDSPERAREADATGALDPLTPTLRPGTSHLLPLEAFADPLDALTLGREAFVLLFERVAQICDDRAQLRHGIGLTACRTARITHQQRRPQIIDLARRAIRSDRQGHDRHVAQPSDVIDTEGGERTQVPVETGRIDEEPDLRVVDGAGDRVPDEVGGQIPRQQDLRLDSDASRDLAIGDDDVLAAVAKIANGRARLIRDQDQPSPDVDAASPLHGSSSSPMCWPQPGLG